MLEVTALNCRIVYHPKQNNSQKGEARRRWVLRDNFSALHTNLGRTLHQCNVINSNRMVDHARTDRTIDRSRDARSKSPSKHYSKSYRTRSPHRHQHHHRHAPATSTNPKELPYNSRQLTKRDLDAFKPMFALYLDIQKGKDLEDMDDTEVKGRWKSFIGKW